MPAKGPGVLTADEIKLLVFASKFFAALHERVIRMPSPYEQMHWDTKADEDLVCRCVSTQSV